jgi:hypothetical protein
MHMDNMPPPPPTNGQVMPMTLDIVINITHDSCMFRTASSIMNTIAAEDSLSF